MPAPLHQDEFNRLLQQSPEARADYCIEQLADWEELWGINDEQGWLVQAAGEQTYVSLWSHPKFAEDIVSRLMPDKSASEIDFEMLLEQWLPLLKQEQIAIAVFPDRYWQGVLLSAEDFEKRLQAAMKKLN